MYQFNRKEYEERMKWYQDARFGMFIHWGLYSIPARGEWVRSTEEMPEEEYLPFMKEFDARDYNPKQWAKEAKAAGMKYVVLTANTMMVSVYLTVNTQIIKLPIHLQEEI